MYFDEPLRLLYFTMVGIGLSCFLFYFIGAGFFYQKKWPYKAAIVSMLFCSLALMITGWGNEASERLIQGSWINIGGSEWELDFLLRSNIATSAQLFSILALLASFCLYVHHTLERPTFIYTSFYMHVAVSVAAITLSILSGSVWSSLVFLVIIVSIGMADRIVVQFHTLRDRTSGPKDILLVTGFTLSVAGALYWAFSGKTNGIFANALSPIEGGLILIWYLGTLLAMMEAPQKTEDLESETGDSLSLMRVLLFSRVFPAWGFLLILSHLSPWFEMSEEYRTVLVSIGATAILCTLLGALSTLKII
jgi:hypothetical protein